MRVYDSRGRSYARCCAVRRQMLALHEDLAVRRGWSLVAGILLRRFDLAFVRFLDAPNRAHLDAVLEFEAEMHDLDTRFARPKPGFG